MSLVVVSRCPKGSNAGEEKLTAKKSKSKKSKAKKKKSESPETKSEIPDEAVSPSFSTDDVYNLLKAVNEITLKRMEDKNDAYSRNETDLLNYLKRSLDANSVYINETHLWVSDIRNTILPRIEQAILAIKAKTDKLP